MPGKENDMMHKHEREVTRLLCMRMIDLFQSNGFDGAGSVQMIGFPLSRNLVLCLKRSLLCGFQ